MTTEQAKKHIIRMVSTSLAKTDTDRNMITSACEIIFQLGMGQGRREVLEGLRGVYTDEQASEV